MAKNISTQINNHDKEHFSEFVKFITFIVPLTMSLLTIKSFHQNKRKQCRNWHTRNTITSYDLLKESCLKIKINCNKTVRYKITRDEKNKQISSSNSKHLKRFLVDFSPHNNKSHNKKTARKQWWKCYLFELFFTKFVSKADSYIVMWMQTKCFFFIYFAKVNIGGNNFF